MLSIINVVSSSVTNYYIVIHHVYVVKIKFQAKWDDYGFCFLKATGLFAIQNRKMKCRMR